MKKKIKAIFGLIVAFPQMLIFICCCGGGKIKKDLIHWKSVYRLENINDVWAFCYLMMSYPELRSIFYWRLGKLAKFIFFWLPGRTNLFLFTDSKNVEGGFFVVHGWGTVVNASYIGVNFCVGQNVTIGSRNCKEPNIGNNVSIWTNAIVLGDIDIGNNCQIGAGAVVVKSLPHNCVVVPSKSLIIRQNGEKCNLSL